MMTSIKRALSSFLFSVLAIGLCVVLAACGSDDPIDISDNSGETTSTSSTDSTENSSETSSTTAVTTPPEQTVITTSGGPVDDTTSTSQNSQQQTSNSSSSNSTTTANSGGTGGPFAPGINCDLGGNWRGVFYNDVTGVSEAIQATVTRTGLDIIIRTSRTRPPGQLLTGSVNGQCGIRVIDAFDGEDWTTKFGGADANQIRIADFLIEDRDELTGRDPLNIIELVR